MDFIKTVEDAKNYLRELRICSDILDTLAKLPVWSFAYKVASYRAVIAALTHNEKRHLTSGRRWYPTIEFCCPGKLEKCYGDVILGQIESEGKKFDVVGGCTHDGGCVSLGYYDSEDDVAGVWPDVSFRSVGAKEIALYISKQFGRLLFEIQYGGTNCSWKMDRLIL